MIICCDKRAPIGSGDYDCLPNAFSTMSLLSKSGERKFLGVKNIPLYPYIGHEQGDYNNIYLSCCLLT